MLEYNSGTARLIGVFASRDLAVDVARSWADYMLRRIAKHAGSLYGAAHGDPASYEIRCEEEPDRVHLRIRNARLDEFEEPSWLVQAFTIIGPPQAILTHQPPLLELAT